jgi:predicted PurR-regulated permease PerM
MAGAARATSARVLPLWLIVLLGVAAAAGALWGLHAGAGLIAPVFLAFVLTVVAHPMIGALRRRRFPTWLAVAAAVLVVDGGLILFAVAVWLSVAQLATVLPTYSDEWQAVLDNVRSGLSAAGVGPEQIDQALHQVQPSTVIGALLDVLAGLLNASVALVIVLATALFMAAEGAGLPGRLAAVPGAARLQAALGEFARGTRRYIVVTTIFGFLVAVADAIALYLMGIPLPLLWGLLSFLTNYIPNIGFILGLAPPTLLALLVGGPDLAVLVVVIYAVINFILQSIVQPIFVGDAVGLSVTLTFLSVILWTVVLGPLGAVLAIPLTLFAHAILVGQDPARAWARTLLAGASAPAPPRPARPRARTADHRRSAAVRRAVPAAGRRTGIAPRPRTPETPSDLVEAAPRR